MPIHLERREPGVYLGQLSGTIHLQELLTTQQTGAQVAAQSGDPRYVLILQIDPSTHMPFDLRESRQVVEQNRASHVFTVGASWHIKLLSSMLARLFGIQGVEHYNNVDQALERARSVLRQS
ncbi:MAG: hypothetical protein MUF87_19870 [Anaerolineae bacterium]|jgi:hypothetical protein|nr:hypothetical protein [Anaerolineae bacterium]